MKLRSYLFVLSCLCLLSCGNKGSKTNDTVIIEKTKMEPLKWVTGKYINVTNEGMYFEEWARVDSFSFKGKNFLISKKTNDTAFTMTMNLIRQKDKTTMYYFIKGLSKGNGSEFTLTKEDGNLFVFENPFHDFNSIMQYIIMGDTAIEITERGFMKNQERVEKSIMKKID